MNLTLYLPRVAEHRLTPLLRDTAVQCWRLLDDNNPQSDMEITLTPSGVTLVCNAFRQPVMHAGMFLTEFMGEMDAKYLARRFLTKQWSPRHAEDFLTEMKTTLVLYAKSEDPERAREALGFLEELNNCGAFGDPFESALAWQRDFGQIIEDMVEKDLFDLSECYPPEVYPTDHVGLLAAYQYRFREQYMKHYWTDTPTTAPVV